VNKTGIIIISLGIKYQGIKIIIIIILTRRCSVSGEHTAYRPEERMSPLASDVEICKFVNLKFCRNLLFSCAYSP